MTTRLERPLAREVLIGGDPYKITISSEGLRVTRKGHHKGAEIAWENLIALGERVQAPPREQTAKADVPEAIAADVAREVKKANEALGRAATALARAGALPAELLTSVEPDPLYGSREHSSDWFIEPLLTIDEVASILRLSKRAVARLPLRPTIIEGAQRYRQSEVRSYLTSQERRY